MRLRLTAPNPGRAEQSRAIVAAIVAHPAFSRDRPVALFSPLPSEPDVEEIWRLAPGQFCYPRVVQGEMEFVSVQTLDDLITSPWHPHIREHAMADAPAIRPAEIGIILVPGLAFTRKGIRLGRGGGYYDRYLAALPAATWKVGVCFAQQIVEQIPTELHDQGVDVVVTEDGAVP